jgi:hypothetical protein
MAYKELSSKAGSSTAKLYSIFKSALYDFDFADQSGVEQESKIDEFLQLKGINYNKSLSKQTKARKYLDYASVEELELLVEGLDKIRQTVVLANKNFAGFPNVEQDVARLGRELRNKFYEETGVQVEFYPVQEETIGRVKSAQSKI